MNTGKNKKLDFVIIGFPRCGTTALNAWLRTSPQIIMPEYEPGFFYHEDHQVRIEKWLAKNMKNIPDNNFFCGEKTPGYVLNPPEIQPMKRIYEYNPNIRLICCIRHPIQELHSFYNLRVLDFRSGETHGIDPSAYTFPGLILSEQYMPEHAAPGFCGIGPDYVEHLSINVFPFFPRDSVSILIQERFWRHVKITGIYHSEFYNAVSSQPSGTLDGIISELSSTATSNLLPFFQYDTIDYTEPRYKECLYYLLSRYVVWSKKTFDFLGFEIQEWDKITELYRELL